MKRIPKTITLLLTFMKIGLFTFGGGSVVVKDNEWDLNLYNEWDSYT